MVGIESTPNVNLPKKLAEFITVATTRMAPPTLAFQLNFSAFTEKSCHFLAGKLKFWVLTFNFVLEKVAIDVFLLLKMANQLGQVSSFLYE